MSLAAALLKSQTEFPPIPMDSVNPHFKNKFASLGSILERVLPVLNANGIVLMQHPTIVDGKPALRTKLLHESGEFEEDTILLILDKENSQGQGSALSYARRYAVMAALGLVADEDDDGQAASKPVKQNARAATDANSKRLHALIGELASARGVPREQVQSALRGALGIESMANLSAENAARADGILAEWKQKVAAS